MNWAERVEAIDAFRGLAILMMVVADFLAGAENAPPWLKHAPDPGYTIIDLIAPMFVFAIGLTWTGTDGIGGFSSQHAL